MAWIEKRNGRATWHACWKQNGKKIVRNTKMLIKGDPGMSARATERAAQLAADNMESVAKGICSIDAAIDAIRAVGVANGMCKAVPSVVELLDSVHFSLNDAISFHN